ncbi:U-box domain-containing protein 35-like [Camellia sinensis]|uniref:U-box domain-containing protein 35-like n=1 Tax=Camellia sinensis TaxID=4442 RepID=UPI00103607C3|nr:U-box domain-containing protein 35-like [Camellia sinensis]
MRTCTAVAATSSSSVLFVELAGSASHSSVCDVNNVVGSAHRQQLEKQTKDLFLTFHCFCTRKDIQCLDVILEDTDIVKALLEYVTYTAIENLVLGASSRHGFIRRFKISDIPSNVSKGAPDFCTVYVISKGKISSVRNACRSAPFTSPLQNQIFQTHKSVTSIASSTTTSFVDSRSSCSSRHSCSMKGERTPRRPRNLQEDYESVKPAVCSGTALFCVHDPTLEDHLNRIAVCLGFCQLLSLSLCADTDIVKALLEYVTYTAIENLVLGASSRHGFIRRFKISDIPSNVSKGAPDFCTVYVISKGKISSVRNACRSAPFTSPLHNQIFQTHKSVTSIASSTTTSFVDSRSSCSSRHSCSMKGERTPRRPRNLQEDYESVKLPFDRGEDLFHGKLGGELLESDTDISFVSSSDRPSTSSTTDRMSIYMESGQGAYQNSTSSEHSSFGSLGAASSKLLQGGFESTCSPLEFSSSSIELESNRTSCSSQSMDEVEAEMRRLKLELKQTMEMYSTACKEALCAKQKAMELQRWRLEEERRLEEARLSEEAALAIVEKEKAKCTAAMETTETAQRIAELESQRRINVEMNIIGEAEYKKNVFDRLVPNDVRYRKYTIEEIEVATDFFDESRKIGEGGYGPVFKCYLDHTPVAVKVLRPDAAQGREQFQQEVEVLSCMRHPNMVLLLGACPEYGCLVYEYMANGSLEDRIFRRGNTPSLSWQLRFRIAAEIATGMLFLHQTKPEPLVHRDLKPANILLDHNYVSKISDVGLARLVPPSVADDVTQYRMTSTAGTFCYIDPEYQQTGMLGIKSDVYSLGVMLLQLITAKPAMGLAHQVGRSIEKGTFVEMLDPTVPDWPIKEVLCFAKIAVQCAELRRKDRPDLGKVVMPELDRLRDFGEEQMSHFLLGASGTASAILSPKHNDVSMAQEVMSDPLLIQSGCESSKSYSSTSSMTENLSGIYLEKLWT